MRTTLNLDDDVLEAAKDYAAARSIPLGNAISHLLRRGLNAAPLTRLENGFLVVQTPEDSPVITSELVRRLEAEAD